MAYSKQTWVDGAGGGTPINASRLTHIENGIADAATSDELSDGLAGKSDVGHTHSDLVDALAGKAGADHTHPDLEAEIAANTSAIAGKAAASHTHATGDITGLTAAINSAVAAAVTDPTLADLPPGSTITVQKDLVTGFWPASYDASGLPVYSGGSASAGVRPTARSDIYVQWKGADPSPGTVPSGTGGMLDNVDTRFKTP